ncbi:complex I NDUFA9 subunit family protein [Propionivibrio sp.]|uniref:complex I NDUFA9 subunit family protein n=1 Tax=Propionivibrio sp. TaxID=2212460 RepID=UPI002607054A|nr:complex I NDUFA9 subunit family protein [Propionivibrio sp.]
MELKKVLLIGGSGFVGSWIANRLSERGIRVTIPTRHRDNTKQLILLPTVYTVEADVHDPQALASLVHGVDAVINLVGILHDKDSSQPYGKRFAAAHVELPRKILAAMKQAGVRRLVHMSALKAASDAPSAYLRSKGDGEAMVCAAGGEFDITVFRPSVIFGPGDAFLNTFATLLRLFPILPLAGAAARFQPVYVGDVADAFAGCLGDHATFGQIYELCGPKVYTLRELVEYTASLIGRRPLVIKLPDTLARLQACMLGLLPNPPMSLDNLRSMQIDNTSNGHCNYPDWHPKRLEAVAPAYLSALSLQPRLDGYRCRARRS